MGSVNSPEATAPTWLQDTIIGYVKQLNVDTISITIETFYSSHWNMRNINASILKNPAQSVYIYLVISLSQGQEQLTPKVPSFSQTGYTPLRMNQFQTFHLCEV